MTTTNKLFTLDEYLAYDPPTERRYELENGVVIEMPTESDINIQIAMYLISVFVQILPIRLLRRGTEVAVSGSRATVRQPDLMVLTEESYTAVSTMSRSLLTPDMPPPALVVEVVSPGKENTNRDYRYKRSEYAARGIAEYWIIDPKQAQVIVLTLVDGLYEEAVYRDEESLVSRSFPGIDLTAKQVLQLEDV